jgi:Xaa-Pro dipeptidase
MDRERYVARIRALQALQRANAVDCVALVPGANLRYFTGLAMHLSERPTLALIPAGEAGEPGAEPHLGAEPRFGLVVPTLEAEAARAQLPGEVTLFPYSDEEGHEHAFFRAAEELGLENRTIGVEYLAMRLLEARRLEQSAPGARLLAVEPWLPKLRQVKDEAEIGAMRRAVEMAQNALQRLLDEGAIRPGRTERELAADLQIALLREGSQGEAFSPLVVAGPNSALPHVGPGDRPLAEGDLLIVDWGAVYQGYRSDITRTFVLGEPTAEMLRIHDAVLAANQSARLGVRPGLPGQEVDRLARRAITQAGYGQFFIHRTGHGLGLETHEPPYMVEGNLKLLEAGMTFTVEPGIYVPGLGGVRIEDDVAVTADGSQTLTSLPRELVQIHT